MKAARCSSETSVLTSAFFMANFAPSTLQQTCKLVSDSERGSGTETVLMRGVMSPAEAIYLASRITGAAQAALTLSLQP
jgi:hypothetical protein